MPIQEVGEYLKELKQKIIFIPMPFKRMDQSHWMLKI